MLRATITGKVDSAVQDVPNAQYATVGFYLKAKAFREGKKVDEFYFCTAPAARKDFLAKCIAGDWTIIASVTDCYITATESDLAEMVHVIVMVCSTVDLP